VCGDRWMEVTGDEVANYPVHAWVEEDERRAGKETERRSVCRLGQRE
jgi:hypothetical protein